MVTLSSSLIVTEKVGGKLMGGVLVSLLPPFVPHDPSLKRHSPVLSSSSAPGESTPAFCSGLEAPAVTKKKTKTQGEVASIVL